MAQAISDCFRIMRLTLGRRNENDPDSNDSTFFTYLDNFIQFTMTDDVKLFEQNDTLSFDITTSNTTGVFTFNKLKLDTQTISPLFANITHEAFITLKSPVNESISWNRLLVWQDPGVFFAKWGINNDDILVKGFPTDLLYYGNELTFRTIQDNTYLVKIYGYKINPAFSSTGDPALPFDHWLRYLAYGASLDYARDYRYEAEDRNRLEKDFAHERKLLLTRNFNQVKHQRGVPHF